MKKINKKEMVFDIGDVYSDEDIIELFKELCGLQDKKITVEEAQKGLEEMGWTFSDPFPDIIDN